MKVKITPTLAGDYQSRDVYEPCWDTGMIEVDAAMFADMLDDAKHYADKTAIDIDDIPGLRLAYRAHRDRLLKLVE